MEVTRPIVEEAVRERIDRMQSDSVDLLQVRLPFYPPSPAVGDLSRDLPPSSSHTHSFTGMTITTSDT